MKKAYLAVMAGAAVALILCVVSLAMVRPRMVVAVDGFEINDASGITVGQASGVCVDGVPHEFLTITRENGSLSWKVNGSCVKDDSLCYFKINNTNPNLHALDKGQKVVVKCGGNSFSIGHYEIDKLLEGHKSQYVMLRNVLEKQRQMNGATGNDFRRQQQIKSFFYRERKGMLRQYGPWQLVILDNYTTIGDGSTSVGYATSGSAGRQCKVQFFKMAEYSFQSDDNDIFQIGDVNYMAKPVLLATSWGAGHVMVTDSGNGLAVSYPKPLVYTEDCRTLRQMASTGTTMLSMVQSDGSLPVGKSLYIPQISTSLRQEVCQLRVDADSMAIEGHKLKPQFTIMPELKAIQTDAGGGVMHLHTGIINFTFILSYLWLPLAIFLLVFVAYPWFVSLQGISIRGKTLWADRLPMLFQMLVAIAFVYGVCRVMIAVKLSWTYPYFTKLTGVVTVSVALMLLLIFCLSLVLNHPFLTAMPTVRRQRNHTWRQWGVLVVPALGLVACGAAMAYSDSHFSKPMLDAYLPGEVFSKNIIKWTALSGINDLHRSVPYTLFAANILAVAALVVLNVWHALLPVRKMGEKAGKWMGQRLNRLGGGIAGSLGKVLPKKIGNGNVQAIATSVVYAFFVAAVSILPGNFSTALISLVLIAGMGHSLIKVQYADNRVWAFVTSMVITVIMLLSAIVMPNADKGYFTNYLGFASLAVALYVIVSKYSRRSPSVQELKANRVEHKWMNRTLAAVMVAVLLVVPKVMTLFYDADDVDYSRTTRRFQMFSQFEKYRNSGYRYAVSDAEFMTVMIHSMYNASGTDPLSPERHQLHPSVSTGQSPVVLNDVSLPVAFFGTYGWSAYIVYFLLLVLMLTAVVASTLPTKAQMDRGVDIDVRLLWRMLAVLMWAGTSFYLYTSYVGQFPFTGRLNPGFGVDSVGEALESVILMAFMTATTLAYQGSQEKQQHRL